MSKLDTPDLCARLDTMKMLCEQLERVQDDPETYHRLVARIQVEADALRDTVCGVSIGGPEATSNRPSRS
jgi:hypothetical protein